MVVGSVFGLFEGPEIRPRAPAGTRQVTPRQAAEGPPSMSGTRRYTAAAAARFARGQGPRPVARADSSTGAGPYDGPAAVEARNPDFPTARSRARPAVPPQRIAMSTSYADSPPKAGAEQPRPARSPSGRALARRLLAAHPLGGRELALAGLLLAVLALVTFIGHIRHGGFYYDDWGVLSIVRFPAPSVHGALSALWPFYSKRPGEVGWYALVDSTLGFHASQQLILAAAMLTLEVLCVFALMRMLGLATLHALLICALVLIFPFSDSQWLWAIMSMATLASSLALIGVMLAIKALESDGRRAIALHAISLALYVASILSYEVFAALGCLAGLAYARRVGLRRARTRWALDVAVILGTLISAKVLLPRDHSTPVTTQSVSGLLHHASLVIDQGSGIFSSALVPIGSPDQRIVLALLLLVFAGAAAMWWRLPVSDPARPLLRGWLVIALIGGLVASAAWAIYLPAIDYYSPGALGTGNRVNGLAGVGVVMFLYATGVLAAACLWRLAIRAGRDRELPTQSPGFALLAVLGALLLGAGYLHRATRDASAWNRAVTEQNRMLATITRLLPQLHPHVTLYTFDHPTQVGSWVGVFRFPWDLSGALKHAYGFRDIGGVPIDQGTPMVCGVQGFYPFYGGTHRGSGTPYGHAYLVDVKRRRAAPVTDRVRCLTLTRDLRAGTHI